MAGIFHCQPHSRNKNKQTNKPANKSFSGGEMKDVPISIVMGKLGNYMATSEG